MKLPNFIIIGAAKSGTTTLYKYLCRHPNIFMCKPKEPDFFSVDQNYAKGLEYYYSLFSDAKPNQICGEASTTYSRWQQHPHTAKRLSETLPNVKLIYIMRHPGDRAYSFYVHRLKGSRFKPSLSVAETFEKTIQQQSEFIDSSYYLEQIHKYISYYPRESCLFLLMEDLINKPADTINQVCRFLDIDSSINLMEGELIKANKASDHPDWYVKSQLAQPFKKIPGLARLASKTPKAWQNKAYQQLKKYRYDKWVSNQYMPPPMLESTRQNLLDTFKIPNQELSDFLDRDLSHWSH